MKIGYCAIMRKRGDHGASENESSLATAKTGLNPKKVMLYGGGGLVAKSCLTLAAPWTMAI